MIATLANSRIRRLTSTEVDAYNHLPPELAKRVWLIDVGYLPGRFLGVTLGRFILLADMPTPDGTDLLLAHELVHVRQWTELGVVGFGYRYLRDFITGIRRSRRWRRAYLDIEAEQEARRDADGWAQSRPDRKGSTPGHPGEAGV